jgi:hypothetical protein
MPARLSSLLVGLCGASGIHLLGGKWDISDLTSCLNVASGAYLGASIELTRISGLLNDNGGYGIDNQAAASIVTVENVEAVGNTAAQISHAHPPVGSPVDMSALATTMRTAEPTHFLLETGCFCSRNTVLDRQQSAC